MTREKALTNMQNDPEIPDFMRELVSGCFAILSVYRDPQCTRSAPNMSTLKIFKKIKSLQAYL